MVWRSHLIHDGLRRANYYIKHLVVTLAEKVTMSLAPFQSWGFLGVSMVFPRDLQWNIIANIALANKNGNAVVGAYVKVLYVTRDWRNSWSTDCGYSIRVAASVWCHDDIAQMSENRGWSRWNLSRCHGEPCGPEPAKLQENMRYFF